MQNNFHKFHNLNKFNKNRNVFIHLILIHHFVEVELKSLADFFYFFIEKVNRQTPNPDIQTHTFKLFVSNIFK